MSKTEQHQNCKRAIFNQHTLIILEQSNPPTNNSCAKVHNYLIREVENLISKPINQGNVGITVYFTPNYKIIDEGMQVYAIL